MTSRHADALSRRLRSGSIWWLWIGAALLTAAAVGAAEPPACTTSKCNGCAPGFYCCEESGACWDPQTNPNNCIYTTCGTGGTCDMAKVCKKGNPRPHNCKPTSNGDRTLTFVNQCAESVRIGVNGGFVKEVPACTPGACPAGTTCLASRKPTPACFWNFPTPSTGSNILAPSGQKGATATYDLDNPPQTLTVKNGPARGQHLFVKWSGNVYAATGCDASGDNCDTGMCPLSEDGILHIVPCESGVGPVGPITLAEFTLSFDGLDYYDISQGNGFNVPISMAPAQTSVHQDDPYWCQTPGSTTPTSKLQACTWSFDTTVDGTDYSTTLQTVSSGGSTCEHDGHCTTPGEVCGTSFSPGTLNVAQTCGRPIGWWNADELCGYTNGGFGTPLDCSTTVSGQGTNQNLYLCNGPNSQSCYQTTATDTCCGCPNWSVGGHILPLAPGFECYDQNKSWQNIAEPWAYFNKAACPTSYSFAFDDATSTFTCETANPTCKNPNTMDYTITFCPDGKTGF
ncbi:MAG: thaumatin family protein [Acidobacteriota bacterium]